MKWLVLATLALSAPTVSHADFEGLDLSSYESETEMPSDVFQELGSLDVSTEDSSLDIGGDELELDARHNRRHKRHPRWDRFPRHPRYIPVPIFRRHNVCFARNGRGVTFRVSGFASRWSVQDAAVRFCERNSARPWTCRPLGCR